MFTFIFLQLGKLELHIIDRDNPETLVELNEEQLANVDSEEVQYEITVCEEQLGKMNPNLAAIQQFKKKVSLDLHQGPIS